MLTKSNRTEIQTYKLEERTFGTPCAAVEGLTQAILPFFLKLNFCFSLDHDISEAWIGLHDHSSEGRYVWVDGSTIPFSEWLPGEPDGNEDENCIVQARGQHSPGWGDRHCLDPKPFVCEVPIPGK